MRAAGLPSGRSARASGDSPSPSSRRGPAALNGLPLSHETGCPWRRTLALSGHPPINSAIAVQHQDGDVVARLAALAPDRGPGERLRDLVCALAGGLSDLPREPFRIAARAALAHIEHPVGIEDQRVADRQRGVRIRQDGGGEDPEERPWLAYWIDAPVLAQDERQRVSAQRHGEVRRTVPVRRRLDPSQGGGAEAEVGALRADRLVEGPEDLARRALRGGGGANRIPGQSRQGRRLGSLSADVADHGGPAARTATEDVIEVAPTPDPPP